MNHTNIKAYGTIRAYATPTGGEEYALEVFTTYTLRLIVYATPFYHIIALAEGVRPRYLIMDSHELTECFAYVS